MPAASASAKPSSSAMSTSRATTFVETSTVWQEVSGGVEEIDLGRRKLASRAYCSLFNSAGPTSEESG